MKKTTFWKSLFLLCALIVGSSSAWAEDATLAPRSVTSTGQQNFNDSKGNAWTFTTDAESMTSSTSYVHAGSGSKKVSYIRFVTSAYSSKTITSIQVKAAAKASSGVTIKIYIGNTLLGTSDELSNTASDGGTAFSVNNTNGYKGDIKVEVSRSTASKNAIYFNEAKVTYTDKPDAPTFNPAGGEFNEAFTLAISSATGTTLKYTTDGTAPATSETAVAVNSNSTEVSIPAATTRVRAIAIKNNINSDEKDVTYTYTLKEVPTFTLSPASLNLGVGEEGDISLTTNSDGEVTFACEDAHVTLSGTGNSRKVSADSEGTYTINVSVAATSTYTAKNGSVTVTVAKHDTSVAINTSGITNTEMKAGVAAGTLSASVTYGDPATAVPSATVTWSSTKPDVATINATTGVVTLIGAGTAQIKATYAGNDAYNGSNNTYNLTVTDSRTNFFTWDLSTASYDANPTDAKIQWSNARAIMKNEQNDGTSVINYIPTSQSSTRFYNKNKVTITPQAGRRITSVEFTAMSSNYAGVFDDETSSWTNATAKAYDKKVVVTPTNSANAIISTVGGTCGFSEVKVFYEEENVTIVDLSSIQGSTYTGKNYATMYYSEYALAVPAGVVAKTYKMVNGALAESRTYENGGTYPVIPAGEAVVIESDEAADYAFEVASTETTPDAESALAGTDAATTVDAAGYKYYKLALNNSLDKVGFFFAVTGGTSINNGAHKAYLRVATGSGEAKSFYLFEDTTTGIANVDVNANDNFDANAPMYNLAGQRVNKSYKGVVIVNGKKMFNK